MVKYGYKKNQWKKEMSWKEMPPSSKMKTIWSCTVRQETWWLRRAEWQKGHIFSNSYLMLLRILRVKMFGKCLKGKFPQTTIWIGWVESNFRNPTVTVWADLDNPFKRSDYAKLCMSALCGWNSASPCDITRGQLSIDFVHIFSQFSSFLGYQ